MIISLRNISYDDLKGKLSLKDRIVLYSCNACIVACGVGGTAKMDALEKALTEDGLNVIGKDLISIGCTKKLVKKRLTEVDKRKMYEGATVIIPLICEDGYEAVEEVFGSIKIIKTAQTLGVGCSTPDKKIVLTTPFETFGLEKRVDGYTLEQAAAKANLYIGSFDQDKNDGKEKVKLIIDGQLIMSSKGQNLLDVCKENGIEIPRFCHHNDLRNYGACRMCVVKIDGFRDLVASCCVAVEEGMNIVTSDHELESYRKMILELIMASGDHNCLTCSKGVPNTFSTCELQTLIRSYGITESRFETLYEKKAADDSSDIMYFDANKCILCGRCVRACEEIAGLCNLGFINRGEKTVITAGLNKQMAQSECVSCMACVKVCPTGALNEKIVYFTGPEWEPTRKLNY